ncbi:sensor histidine kinase [Luteolibacter algae]|uniref:Sensor histidine kinase n=1 Tax=Luteolibacter algae TaxID=454151 RepID=A0ABW5D379_9BACT
MNHPVPKCLALIGVCLLGTMALAQEACDSILEIRQLGRKEAAKSHPVDLTAQVLRLSTRGGGFFAHDGESGIYVRGLARSKSQIDPVPGDIVHIRGITSASDFSPSIQGSQFEITGHATLPKPTQLSASEYHLPALDCSWVSIRGAIVSITPVRSHNAIMLELKKNEILAQVQVPYSHDAMALLAELALNRVSITAVAGTVFNDRGQATDRIFFANSPADFEILRRNTPSPTSQVVPISALMTYGFEPRTPVKTRGTITHINGQDIYLVDEGATLMATIPSNSKITIGDVVELDGFVWSQPIGPAFLAQALRVTGSSPPPYPIHFNPAEPISSSLHGALVELDAKLLETIDNIDFRETDATSQGFRTLLCQSGDKLFKAQFSPSNFTAPPPAPGSILRLTGICKLFRNQEIPWQMSIDSFEIDLLAEGGVSVVRPSPWWTTNRLLWGLALTFGLLALVFGWGILLRRTVDRQTRVIAAKIERESTLEERQRIAREFHDSLEQGLAGMAIQLRSCMKLMNRHAERAMNSLRHSLSLSNPADRALRSHLETRREAMQQEQAKTLGSLTILQNMLSYCSLEARSSILDLRGGLLESMDLTTALRATLEPLFNDSGITLRIASQGSPPRLQRRIENHLFRIAKEAATNSLRHARPEHVAIRFSIRSHRLELEISDDGCGFDPKMAEPVGHFGLQGMKERAQKIGATLEIDSSSTEGTRVRLNLDMKPEDLLHL